MPVSNESRAAFATNSSADIVWPYETDDGDHFETSFEAYEDIAPLLRALAKAKARRHNLPLNESAKTFRIYDPYFCTGQTNQHLKELGFPTVINRCRDFYEDVQNGVLPQFDVMVTNPPYSGDHKERLFNILLERQRLAKTNGDLAEPFLLLLPSWTAEKSLYRTFLQELSKIISPGVSSSIKHAASEQPRSKHVGREETSSGVFYVCRAGNAGRPQKYSFSSPQGAGKDVCPFFGLWFCGGFGEDFGKAIKAASRGWGEGFWEPDGLWHAAKVLLNDKASLPQSVKVLWEEGTQSVLLPEQVRGGRRVFGSLDALKEAGLARSEDDVRQRWMSNEKRKSHREKAIEELEQARKKAREDAVEQGQKRKRKETRGYVRDNSCIFDKKSVPAGVCTHFFSEKGCSRGEKCRFPHTLPT